MSNDTKTMIKTRGWDVPPGFCRCGECDECVGWQKANPGKKPYIPNFVKELEDAGFVVTCDSIPPRVGEEGGDKP